MQQSYNKDSKLDFGMYFGYDLGIVYVFDPSYITWCIKKLDRFYISDLDELKEYGVINKKLDWQYRMVGDPSLIPDIDTFDTFDELVKNVNLGTKKYIFSEAVLKRNQEKEYKLQNGQDWGFNYNSG